MASELDELAAARTLADAGKDHEEVAARASRLAKRLALGRFHVSVLGEFKRGKSTCINALLGADVLPTGVLPLTAVATEVAFGNEREVARVEVRIPAALLDADGAILVLSADAPPSDWGLLGALGALSDRRAPTFYVLNKVDHLAPAARDEVRRFVTDAVAAELGHKERLWCVDALVVGLLAAP